MTTYIIMSILLFYFAFLILWGGKLCTDSNHFFDINNTKSMRGIWSLIVILVHIPTVYQNRIQDIIGSFAYIGVTFFFMTSAYGLTMSNEHKPEEIKIFWRKRLPKLLITNWLINTIFALINFVLFKKDISVFSLFMINAWVLWLLGCYLLFWLTQLLFKGNSKLDYYICCLLIAIISLIVYFLEKQGVLTGVTWVTECYGFIWGILLLLLRDQFVKKGDSKWIRNVLVLCLASLVFGIAYLKFKPIVFFGDYLLKIILGIAITAFILMCNVKIKIGNKISFFLGEISFEVYLIHGFVFGMIDKLCKGIQSGYFILISIVLTIIFAVLAHMLAKCIIKNIYKIFLRVI